MDFLILFFSILSAVLLIIHVTKSPKDTLTGEDLEKVRQDMLAEIRQTRQELSSSVAAGLQASANQTEQKLESIRNNMEVRLAAMQQGTDRHLTQMRQTVDEKLQQTLEEKLHKSFGLVSKQLQAVYEGLGEMRNLATGVGDLKKVLSNVKTRGILGEVQLGAILDQILTTEQYTENVAPIPGSGERVEFALRLPGDDSGEVLLPIDAKFPMDAYAALLDAYDLGDKAAIETAAKELERRVRSFGKDIHDKYIAPPYTTDFGIMFVPVEGMYAELVRRGVSERLQREFKIIIAGPTTMAALLNSLQMGFKTLAIQKRSGEVWKVLGSVKSEFDTFGKALIQAQNRLNQASSELENLVGVRTRQIQRKLNQVTEFSSDELTAQINPSENESKP